MNFGKRISFFLVVILLWSCCIQFLSSLSADYMPSLSALEALKKEMGNPTAPVVEGGFSYGEGVPPPELDEVPVTGKVGAASAPDSRKKRQKHKNN